jgi:hypothetical protein
MIPKNVMLALASMLALGAPAVSAQTVADELRGRGRVAKVMGRQGCGRSRNALC